MGRTRRVSLFLLAAILLGTGLAGCSGKDRDAASKGPVEPCAGGTVRVMQEVPRTLDPILVDDVYEGVVVNQIFEGLVRLDGGLSVLPSLAESWVVSEDGRLYQFTLRSGVRFHDGRPVTAGDVLRSFHRALDPGNERACLAETYMVGIEGGADYLAGRESRIRGLWTEGDRVVCLRLEEPLSFFLSVLCMDQLKIFPPPDPNRPLERFPVGTGPFRFVARNPDDSIILARSETYWGSPALIDTLVFVPATHSGAEDEVVKLLRHEVDVISIGGSHRSLVGEVAGYRVLRSPDIGVTFLGLNAAVPPLDQLEVRQAIAMAVDREKLITPETAAFLEAATGVLPPRFAGYQPTPKILPFSPEQARAKLASVGYNESHPVPPIDFYTNFTTTRRLGLELVRQLALIGITLRVHELTWPDLDGRITAGKAGLFSLSWIADVPDPDALLYFMFKSGEPNNFFSFSDPEVDSLLAVGRRTAPGPERFAVYRRAEAKVLEQAPMIPLFNGSTLYAWNPCLAGVEVNPFGFALTPFDKVWFNLADSRPAPQGEGVR